MKAHSTNAGGFTLIETTIAMVVMMVVGLGATSLFLYSIRSNSGGENRSQALAIAQQRLELLRELPYNHDDLAIGQYESTVILQNLTADSPSAGYASSGGGAETYAAAAASTGGNRGDVIASGKPGKGTPTPTPGGGGGTGGTGGGSGDDDTYKVVLDIEGLPAGSPTPTQKRITVTVTPVNGHGTASWVNQNPVVIVQYRSSPSTGPFKL